MRKILLLAVILNFTLNSSGVVFGYPEAQAGGVSSEAHIRSEALAPEALSPLLPLNVGPSFLGIARRLMMTAFLVAAPALAQTPWPLIPPNMPKPPMPDFTDLPPGPFPNLILEWAYNPKPPKRIPEARAITDLKDDDSDTRLKAARVLGWFGTLDGAVALHQAIQSERTTPIEKVIYADFIRVTLRRLDLSREAAATALGLERQEREMYLKDGVLAYNVSVKKNPFHKESYDPILLSYQMGFARLGPSLSGLVSSVFGFNEAQIRNSFNFAAQGDQVLGFYNPAVNGVAMKDAPDFFSTFFHEIGHALWDTFPEKTQKELVALHPAAAEDLGKYVSEYAQTGDHNSKDPSDPAQQALSEILALWVGQPDRLFDEKSGIAQSKVRPYIEAIAKSMIRRQGKKFVLEMYGLTSEPFELIPWSNDRVTYEQLLAARKTASAMISLWKYHPELVLLDPTAGSDEQKRFWIERMRGAAQAAKKPVTVHRYSLDVEVDPSPSSYLIARKHFLEALQRAIEDRWNADPQVLVAPLVVARERDALDRYIERSIQANWAVEAERQIVVPAPAALRDRVPDLSLTWRRGQSIDVLRAAYKNEVQKHLEEIFQKDPEFLFLSPGIEGDKILRQWITEFLQSKSGLTAQLSMPTLLQGLPALSPDVPFPLTRYEIGQSLFKNKIFAELLMHWYRDPRAILLNDRVPNPLEVEMVRAFVDFRRLLPTTLRVNYGTYLRGEALELFNTENIAVGGATSKQLSDIRSSLSAFSTSERHALDRLEILLIDPAQRRRLLPYRTPAMLVIDSHLSGTALVIAIQREIQRVQREEFFRTLWGRVGRQEPSREIALNASA